ncbi:hypothetical protein [Pseudogulbenkiania ferrooxidans]|uniref:hypothetical protein n=1 Tax=Pseudogulbenkiania ferrooxidans TaxID=549169 RepID=UPI00256FF1C0|nr:hypothetical protein [Pseudogulbenkiania ferrooxidans]
MKFIMAIKSITPRIIAIICLVSFCLLVYGFFFVAKSSPIQNEQWVGCGNFDEISVGNYNQDILALRIRDTTSHKFILSGDLEISKGSYLTNFSNASDVLLELKPLQNDASFFLGLPNLIKVPLPKKEDVGNQVRIRIVIPDYELFAHGRPENFPLDTYRIGFAASILVSGKESQSYSPFKLDAAVVNVSMSNAFNPRKAINQGQFFINPNKATVDDLEKEYSNDQCAIIIDRPLWYKCMVLCLVITLFLPAIHILYKKDSSPGVDLIAAILGVTTVRSYLLGTSVDWNFYPIDVVLALSVVLVVVISLWKLGSSPVGSA